MDPEARVVITGRDATGAAFASFGRSLSSVRSLAAGFGVALGGRAIAGWIGGAIRAAEATGEHAERIREAKVALDGMKKASDELALSLGTSLVPAMKAVSAVFIGWNRMVTGADPVPFEASIKSASHELDLLKRKLAQMEQFGGYRFADFDQLAAEIAVADLALEELIKKQRQALGLDTDAGSTRARMAVKNMNLLGDFADRDSRAKRPQIEIEWLSDTDGLEEIVVEAQQIAEDGWMRSMPDWKKAFEPLKDEGAEAAQMIGGSFKDAFSDWLVDGEFQFKDFLKRLAAELATSALFSTLGGFFKGKSGGAAGFFSNFFGGARAEGGPVSAGKAYLVGERGPELFMPGRSGTIAAGGAGVTVVQNFYNQFGLPPQVAAQGAIVARVAAQAAHDATMKKLRGER